MNLSDISSLRESASSLTLKHQKNMDQIAIMQDQILRLQAENAKFVVAIDSIAMGIKSLENR